MAGLGELFLKVVVVVVAAATTKAAYDSFTEPASPPAPPREPSVLERNLRRLRATLRKPAPAGVLRRVAVLGQPGAGKSSMLRKVSEGRMVPPPVVGTQTDATDWSRDVGACLLGGWDCLEVADVPGYDTERHPADVMAAEFPFEGFDAFVLMLRGKVRAADEAMYRRLVATGKPVQVVRSGADGLDAEETVLAALDIAVHLRCETAKVLSLSNRTGKGTSALRTWLLAV
jgi:GTP-binding protein EngB required for normal cell division